MHNWSLRCLAPLLLLAGVTAQRQDETWSSWRGPGGAGSAPNSNPPLTWSNEQNVKWKTAIPGSGSSSPIVWRDRIYLTTAIVTSREGRSDVPKEPHNQLALPQPTVVHEYRVLAIDRGTGRVLWNRVATEAVPHEGGHSTNTHASSSAITDGTHIFVNFGSRGLFCLDPSGDVVWSKKLGFMRTRRQYGEAASPALHGNRLVVNWDHEGDSFIAVFDKRTGKEIWRQPRDEVTSWATPIVVNVDDRPQIVINATTATRGYDLESGKLIWSLPGMTVNCIPHPIHVDGVAFVMSGYRGNNLQAIKLAGAKGELAGGNHVLWSHQRGTSYVPSAVLHEQRFYFLRKNNGVLNCLDANTGNVLYEGKRLPGVRSVYASPVAAGGRIYITSRDGVTIVLRAGNEFETLATNRIDEEVDASMAVIGDEIYLRGREHLYCIAATEQPRKPDPKPAATPIRSAGFLGDAEDRTASLSAGDIDGDGDLDLIAANGRHWPGQNRLFRNNGDGTFATAEDLSDIQSTTYTAALGDLDSDGDLDVVVGNDRKPCYVLFNDGKGTFTRGPQVGQISNTRSVSLADLDGINGLDVIFVNRREANRICFHDGNGGYARSVTFGAATDATIHVATGDVDGDGDIDIAAANRNGQQNFVYLNDGKGNFADKVSYGTGRDNSRGVAIVDINGDGKLDIVNANIRQPNTVCYGDGTGGFERTITFGENASSYDVAAADLNGDGRIDIIIGNAGSANVAYLQQQDHSLLPVPFGNNAGGTYCVVAADWNGDSRAEIATANSGSKNGLFRWESLR